MKNVFYVNLSKKTIKINIFNFSRWLLCVDRTWEHLEKLVWSRTDRDCIEIFRNSGVNGLIE